MLELLTIPIYFLLYRNNINNNYILNNVFYIIVSKTQFTNINSTIIK